MVDKLRDPGFRFKVAVVLFVVCFLAQPTAFILPHTLVDRITNFISWAALWLTALDIMVNTDIRREMENGDSDKKRS